MMKSSSRHDVRNGWARKWSTRKSRYFYYKPKEKGTETWTEPTDWKADARRTRPLVPTRNATSYINTERATTKPTKPLEYRPAPVPYMATHYRPSWACNNK